MAKKDYYAILGIPRDADDDAIKKAYRKLAMQYHPDHNPGKEGWANENFKDINEAFSVLGDPEKRRQYEQFGTAGNVGDIFRSPYTQTTFQDLMRDFGTSGLGTGFLDEVFGDLLRDRGFSFKVYRTNSGTPQGFNFGELFRQATAPPPHQKVYYKIAISKEQAAKGFEKDFKRGKKKLRVIIPTGIKDGMTVRLSNALQTTDGQPGDIMIEVKVK